MTVAIIDYGSGNLRSAAKAVARAGASLARAPEVTVTDEAEVVRRAGRIVLPGVGAFADCMGGLAAVPGMIEVLDERVRVRGHPFLGICVGMQLMATTGFEHETTEGLDWIPGEVSALRPGEAGLKIPHMGWNELQLVAPSHPVLAGLPAGAHAYFVHSYVLRPRDPAATLATVTHGEAFAAVVGRDNLIGTQFHPEKSQETGLRLLANFLKWQP